MVLVFWFVIFYIFFVFVFSRFVIPYYGWQKSPLPRKLPAAWEKILEELQRKSHTPDEFLKNAYLYITTRYRGGRFKTLLHLSLVFQDPFSHKRGYLQCNIQNYLLRTLLVKSGRFDDRDILVKTTLLNFFTHQYLRVKVGQKWVDVDTHESYKGVPLGKHSFLFG